MILSCSAGAAPADASTSDTTEIERLDREASERMAVRLEATGDYRILRRLKSRTAYAKPDGTHVMRAVYLDLETTGLDPSVDEIVEIALVPFDCSSDGRVFAVHEPFERLRDPGRPIPPPVTALTGIDDAMVAGLSIDPVEIECFLGPAELILAHNAGFDRRFAERFCGAFARLPWGCSWREVPWAAEGFTEGAKLGQLLAGAGLFHDGHRAVHDCRAGLELLARPLPRSGRTGLALLLESTRATRWRVRAVAAPFEKREALKSRSYRWDPGEGRWTKGWFADVAGSDLDAECDFLRREIYGRHDARIDVRRIDAVDRYSDRI